MTQFTLPLDIESLEITKQSFDTKGNSIWLSRVSGWSKFKHKSFHLVNLKINAGIVIQY